MAAVLVPVPPVVPVEPVVPVAGVGVSVASADGVGVGVALASSDRSAAPLTCGTLSSAGGPGTSGTSLPLLPQPAAARASASTVKRSVERSRRTVAEGRVSAGARPCGGRTWGSR